MHTVELVLNVDVGTDYAGSFTKVTKLPFPPSRDIGLSQGPWRTVDELKSIQYDIEAEKFLVELGPLRLSDTTELQQVIGAYTGAGWESAIRRKYLEE